MNSNNNKNCKLLSIYTLYNVETYLKELVNLSFEYASTFLLTYKMSDFKIMPLRFPVCTSLKEDNMLTKFFYLLNNYFEQDPFYSFLYLYSNFKWKIKMNQFIQLLCVRGSASIKNREYVMAGNLYRGVSLRDFMLSSFKTRESIIDSGVNIYTSGYLTRKLVEGLRNIHIKEIKCSTKYKCRDSELQDVIAVPFLCLGNTSVCSYCVNIDCGDNMFMGFNKGVMSGQALGEPSTQMLLRTFHMGADGIKSGGDINKVNKTTYAESHDVRVSNKKKKVFTIYFNNLYNKPYSVNCNYCYNYKYIKNNFYNNIINKSLFTVNNGNIVILYNSIRKLWKCITLYKNIFKLDSLAKTSITNDKNRHFHSY